MRVMIQLANFSCSGRRVFTCLLEQADLTHRSTTYWFTALYINSTICDCSGNLNKTPSLRQAGHSDRGNGCTNTGRGQNYRS